MCQTRHRGNHVSKRHRVVSDHNRRQLAKTITDVAEQVLPNLAVFEQPLAAIVTRAETIRLLEGA